jgi:RimJ/RimL family protein N-acetyltransferase
VNGGGGRRPAPEMRTRRLLLRHWREDDRRPFAELNADPQVMEHYPSTLTREESDVMVDKIEAALSRDTFGLWALEVSDAGRFIGYTGLSAPLFEAHFTPAVEIGWRLARPAWGKGYASEAAKRALRLAFEEVDLDEVVSFTSESNVRSQAVMRRIGMARDPNEDFDHPRLPAGHRLRRHVLYRLDRQTWRSSRR